MNGHSQCLKTVLLIAGLLLLSACGARRLRVQSGAAAIRTDDTISAGEANEYVVHAEAGQILAVNFVSPKGDVHLAIEGREDGAPLAPAASKSVRWSGAAPATQDYVIRAIGGREDTGYTMMAALMPRAEATEDPRSRFLGMYHLTAPAANSMRDLTLVLNADGSAALVGVSTIKSPTTFAMRGTWRAEGNTATIELTEQDGESFVSPEMMSLEWRDGLLAVTGNDASGWDASSWRTAGLRLAPARGDYHLLVRELHNRLIALGFLQNPRPKDDVYTENTRRAVVAFQNAQGLIPHGVADAATWAALDIASLPARTVAGEPIVYLTFDDGPDGRYTPQILDLLARYNAQATFFVLGEQALYFPDLIRAEAEAGHYVASHGFSHRALEDANREEFSREVQRADKLLRDVAGDLFAWDGDVHYLRPPYGLTDAEAQQYAAEFGYVMVMWDVDSHDWQQPGWMQTAANIVDHVQPGDIVLMHDGGGDRTQTVLALEIVLQQLGAQGYRFKSIFGD